MPEPSEGECIDHSVRTPMALAMARFCATRAHIQTQCGALRMGGSAANTSAVNNTDIQTIEGHAKRH